jgi:broad specificity phosphatase PhoE
VEKGIRLDVFLGLNTESLDADHASRDFCFFMNTGCVKLETGNLKLGDCQLVPPTDSLHQHSIVFPDKELLLVRHGTSLHAGERYIGRTDTPLTPQGHEQAYWLAERLSWQPIDKIYSSPAKRARETLQPFVDGTPVEVMIDADLQEIDFGAWEGMSFEEIQAQAPERVTVWAENGMDFVFPDGECLDAFWKRVCRAGERLAATPGDRIAVVTHGGVIRYLLCYFLGLAPERHRLFQIDLGSITTLLLQEGSATLKGLNAHG